ncbi:cation exchanger 3 [Actinidia rufa]|uniref:Cation exchanger 3 n=1 Tax=Actinidia rufa TaxID=165716 RepID=A0A7J0FTW5_9ERIC|nr:cation exchanger 3 [Actinidia rufa]
MGSMDQWNNLENGDSSKVTAQNLTASLVRKKSDPALASRGRLSLVREFVVNVQQVVLGTKLCLLFPAVPLAVIAQAHDYGRKQSDVNILLLLLGLLSLLLPLMFKYVVEPGTLAASSILQLSRSCSVMMLVAYFAYLYFQLKTHKQLFDADEVLVEEDSDEVGIEENAVIGFWSAFIWLVGMTIVIALLSEYVVGTIEAASDSWGISVSFISVILLPIVGNAAEHAGSIIFALKNKLDGTSHYMKGIVLFLSYTAIAACFFVHNVTLVKFQGA